MTGQPTLPGEFTHEVRTDGPVTRLTSTYDDGEKQVTVRASFQGGDDVAARVEFAKSYFERRTADRLARTMSPDETRSLRRKRTRFGTFYVGLITGADREWLPSVKPRLRDHDGKVHPGLLVGWLSTAAHLSFQPRSTR